MKNFNTTLLTRTALAALACASFAACSRNADQTYVSRDRSLLAPPLASNDTASNTTFSNTTVAANDESMPAADTSAPAVGPDDSATKTDSSTTTTKTTKHTKSKHKAKKHHAKHGSAMAAPRDRAVIYDEPAVATTTTETQINGSVDARRDYDDTISATTMAAPGWRETGLSPFAQEPASRIPAQIGSGQITGEDRSATLFDKSGPFADPAAVERSLIQ